MIWLYSALGFGGVSALIWAYIQIRKSGEDKQKAKYAREEIERAKAIAEAAKDSAKDWINIPLTPDAFRNSLQERINRKNKTRN